MCAREREKRFGGFEMENLIEKQIKVKPVDEKLRKDTIFTSRIFLNRKKITFANVLVNSLDSLTISSTNSTAAVAAAMFCVVNKFFPPVFSFFSSLSRHPQNSKATLCLLARARIHEEQLDYNSIVE